MPHLRAVPVLQAAKDGPNLRLHLLHGCAMVVLLARTEEDTMNTGSILVRTVAALSHKRLSVRRSVGYPDTVWITASDGTGKKIDVQVYRADLLAALAASTD